MRNGPDYTATYNNHPPQNAKGQLRTTPQSHGLKCKKSQKVKLCNRREGARRGGAIVNKYFQGNKKKYKKEVICDELVEEMETVFGLKEEKLRL